MMRLRIYSIFILILSCDSGVLYAEDEATAIAQRAYDRDDGKDSWSEGEMVLIDSDGDERARTLTIAAKDYGEFSKRYIRFNLPKAIEGTSFLSVERHEQRDEQFLYLPSLRRVRRIAADQKDRSFVNTDFTYEDMERRKVERDNHTLAGSENFLGRDCWILERRAKDPEDSQYGKVRLWIAKDIFVVLKTEMFDKKGKIFKVFEAKELKQIDGIWTVTESKMHNLEENHQTLSRVRSIRYNKGIPDEVFSAAYMERKG